MPRSNVKHKTAKPAGRKKTRARKTASAVGRIKKGDANSERQRNAGQLFEALVALQARLRAPGGCPWDREQTHESLRTYLVEETYEVLDALESGRADKIAGELGDLLLQIVFHAELGRESGRFDISDVIEHVHAKMVRRHPHVFGDARARTSGEVLRKWEQLKAEERKAERGSELGDGTESDRDKAGPKSSESILDGVSGGLPALIEAQQLTRRAANVGFDWPRVEGILEKLAEETAELREALLTSRESPRTSHEVEDEVGDLLFVVVNLARFLGFDSEIALKRASRKFKARFQMMERFARDERRPLGDLNAEDLDRLWEQAKAQGALA
ncbi:MAG: nucleoside triphosphate pyrophosphohydrolase [Candidatus Acidiferrales bacterium]